METLDNNKGVKEQTNHCINLIKSIQTKEVSHVVDCRTESVVSEPVHVSEKLTVSIDTKRETDRERVTLKPTRWRQP